MPWRPGPGRCRPSWTGWGWPARRNAIDGCAGRLTRYEYELTARPLVSVLIPNKDHTDDLERCLASLYAKAGYDNFEVHGAGEQLYRGGHLRLLRRRCPPNTPGCRVETYEGAFNFSAVNNFGRKTRRGASNCCC